jgi:hypothetical protein
MRVNAATGSPKNMTPKADTSRSNSSSAAVAASASRQSTLARRAASARAFPSANIGAEMSSAATRPVGPTARAKSSVVAPQPQPTSSTRSPARGAAKARRASDAGAKVVSVCDCRTTHVRPPTPFQKASWSAFDCSGSTMRVVLVREEDQVALSWRGRNVGRFRLRSRRRRGR